MSDMMKKTVEPTPTEPPTPPRTINLALVAILVQVVLSVVRSGLLWAYTGNLKQSVLDANARKSPKSRQDICGTPHVEPHLKKCLSTSEVAKQVHLSLIELTVGSLLITVAVLLAARKIRQGFRSGRTMFIVVSVVGSFIGFAGSPLSVLALLQGGPIPLLVISGAAGLASIAAIVLMYLKESTAFFPPVVRRSRSRSGSGSGSGSPRGLGAIFSPRPAAQRKPMPASGLRSSAASRAAAKEAAPSGAGAVRAKARSDEAAIARGAELARNRAKASKSRRTEL